MSADLTPDAAVQVQPVTRKPRQAKLPEPSIGRTVRYATDPQGLPRAAIITDVLADGVVSLVVLNQFGAAPVPEIPFSEDPKPGHWSWPPRD